MNDSESDGLVKWSIIVIAMISLGSIIAYIFRFNNGLANSQEIFGTFGDYIGGILGVLLSLMAVVLIYRTYMLQRKELQDTREALEGQNLQLKIQQYQNTFFKLLERKDKIVDNIRFKNMERGYEALHSIKREFDGNLKTVARDYGLEHSWNNYKSDLTAYFSNIITTINFIIESGNEINAWQVRDQVIRIFTTNLTPTERDLVMYIIEHYIYSDIYDKEVLDCLEILSKYYFFELNDELKQIVNRK